MPKKNIEYAAKSLKFVQLFLQTLRYISPNLTARVAFKLSSFNRKFPCPQWEQQIIASAHEYLLLPWQDGELAVWSWGQGPGVLLVHGWEGRGSQLGSFVDPLVKKGFRVITFDGPGHGKTSVTRASLIDHTKALIFVAEHFGPIDAFIAHSMGGASLTYAMVNQKIQTKNCALIAAPNLDPKNHYKEVSRLLKLESDITSLLIKYAESHFAIGLDDLFSLEKLSSLQIPTLLVHDKDDKIVTFDKSVELAKVWPNAEILLTQGLGHRRILRDETVIKRVIAFIE